MLNASELTEIYDQIAGRVSTECERASIARLIEIVGRDPDKVIAALAAHSLVVAATAHDLTHRMDERIALVEAAASQVADRLEAVADRVEKRVAVLPASLDRAVMAASRASASLAETAARSQEFVLNETARSTLLKFRDEALPALMTASIRNNVNETLKKLFTTQALVIAGTAIVTLFIGYFIGRYLKG